MWTRILIGLVSVAAIVLGGALGWEKLERAQLRYAKAAAEEELKVAKSKITEFEQKLATTTENLRKTEGKLEQTETKLEETEEVLVQTEKERKILEVANRWLNVQNRIFRAKCIALSPPEEDGFPRMVVKYYELSPHGERLGKPQVRHFRGSRFNVSYLTIHRRTEDVESGVGMAACLLEGVYSDGMQQADMYRFDQPQTRPQAYESGGIMTPEEEEMWQNFWAIAADPERQDELGIVSPMGKGPNYIFTEVGQVLTLRFSSTGGFTKDRPHVEPLNDEDRAALNEIQEVL